MAASPSSVMRSSSIDAKTVQIDALIADIVPKLEDLDLKAIQEVRASLNTMIREARHALAKESTKIYLKRSDIRHPGGV